MAVSSVVCTSRLAGHPLHGAGPGQQSLALAWPQDRFGTRERTAVVDVVVVVVVVGGGGGGGGGRRRRRRDRGGDGCFFFFFFFCLALQTTRPRPLGR